MKKRKTLKVKVPKRVAGVKIPKEVRKGPMVDFLNSSDGQVLIAEALLLAAGLYAARRADQTSGEGRRIEQRMAKVKSAALSGKAAAAGPATTASDATDQQLSHAFGEAMRAFRAALDSASPADEQLANRLGTYAETEIEPQRRRRPTRSRLPEETITALP